MPAQKYFLELCGKEQIEYLSQCSYLDPRFKKSVHCDLPSFTERVKDIALSYTEIIHDTQSQSLQNIHNSHTRREESISSTASTSKDTKMTYLLMMTAKMTQS